MEVEKMGWVAAIEKKNFLLFFQATKSGVAEAAPFCRAASETTNTPRCRCGEQQVVLQTPW